MLNNARSTLQGTDGGSMSGVREVLSITFTLSKNCIFYQCYQFLFPFYLKLGGDLRCDMISCRCEDCSILSICFFS